MNAALIGAGLLVGVYLATVFWNWYYPKNVSRNSFKIHMAEHFYGKNWAKKIIDCENSHTNGDCVLCGGDSL